MGSTKIDTHLDNVIDNISNKIIKYNEHRRLFQKLFQQIKYSFNPSTVPEAFKFHTKDASFVVKCPLSELKGMKIAGVDGGVIHKQLNYFDIALVRAVGVLFYYLDENKPSVKYIPHDQPIPDILSSIEPLTQNEIETLIDLWRMQKEVRCAIDLAENEIPDLLLLDGSVVPNSDPRFFNQNAFLFDQYLNLKALYRKLYNLCKKNKILLAGVVKDSRSAILTNKLSFLLPHLTKMPEFAELLTIDYRTIIKKLRDTDLLYNVLEAYERSFDFLLHSFNDDTDKDLPDWQIHCFYLKTVPYDYPLRIEYPLLFGSLPNITQSLSSIILAVSQFNPEYGLPNVIIESDARAKIHENDGDIIIDEIAAKTGHTHFSLSKRRNRVPFG
ncbi:MAG: DNA double-strand break repair nuclease NurA [Candidatus Heimdallarchaeaceae archaeon]